MLALLFVLSLAVGGIAAGAGKIDICHVPPGNPSNAHTISISLNAWENGHSPHNSHNLDYEGSCNEVPEPTATNVQPSRTPVPTNTGPTEEPTTIGQPTGIPRPTTVASSTPHVTRTPGPAPTFDFLATAIPVCGTESACDLCSALEEMNFQLDRIADALEAANE